MQSLRSGETRLKSFKLCRSGHILPKLSAQGGEQESETWFVSRNRTAPCLGVDKRADSRGICTGEMYHLPLEAPVCILLIFIVSLLFATVVLVLALLYPGSVDGNRPRSRTAMHSKAFP